jgi:probable addiction module antidote protein
MARRKIKASELRTFDPAEYLDGDEAVAEYLTSILEENDPEMLAVALGDIARARGMSDIARSTGLAREALYKALRPGAQPRFETVARVCAALGVKLVAEPVRPAGH